MLNSYLPRCALIMMIPIRTLLFLRTMQFTRDYAITTQTMLTTLQTSPLDVSIMLLIKAAFLNRISSYPLDNCGTVICPVLKQSMVSDLLRNRHRVRQSGSARRQSEMR